MFIHPINVEAFYFNQLPDNIKSIIIENKITSIIGNLDDDKYSKYRKTIKLAKDSKTPLLYREFIKKYNLRDILKDINSENKLYDHKGNAFNIIKKHDLHFLFLTKNTFIPVKIIEGNNYNIYLKDNNHELPITTLINVKAPNKRIAKEIAFAKFEKNNTVNEFIEESIHKID